MINKIYTRFIRIFSGILIGYLFLQGLFTICNMQRITEKVYFMKNDPWRQLFAIALFAVLFCLLKRTKLPRFLDRYGQIVFMISLGLMTAFLLWWVAHTGFWFFGDSEKIYMCADAYLSGNTSPWEPGGYAYMWPHQNGMILLIAFLLQFMDTVSSFYAMYVLLIFFYGITIFGIYKICCHLFGQNALTCIQGLLLSAYLPYAFLVNNIYGDHIGYGFAVLSCLFALNYLSTGKQVYHLISAVTMAFAIIFKQNCMIFMFGILVLYLLRFFRKLSELPKLSIKKELSIKKGKKLSGVCRILGSLILFPVLVLLISSIPNTVIEHHLQIELGAGNSKWAHIAMGLQDTEDAPGWYNTYNERIFTENHYDTRATSEASIENIQESLAGFAQDPAYAWRFFHKKWALEWNNPTFECFTLQSNKVSNVELMPLIKSTIFDGGKINILLIAFFDLCQSVFLFGILFYLISVKKSSPEELLPFVLFIGAFFFWTFWESKSRYVLPFFLLLIPYCAVGYRNMVSAFFEKKTLTTIGILLAVLLFLSLSDVPAVEDSLKINKDTEDYYEYIHEYNKNFMNFRY